MILTTHNDVVERTKRKEKKNGDYHTDLIRHTQKKGENFRLATRFYARKEEGGWVGANFLKRKILVCHTQDTKTTKNELNNRLSMKETRGVTKKKK